MKGCKQDKKEQFEWARRGKDLENLNKVVNAWSDQLIAADLATCLEQLRLSWTVISSAATRRMM